MRKYTLLLAALLLSPQSSSFVSHADASRARGVIRAVDLNVGTVTLHTRQDAPLTVQTNPRTEIVRNDQPATLRDLQPGDDARVVYDSSTLLAASIVARGPEPPTVEPVRIQGTIAGVDLRDRTLTIFTLGGRTVRLNITPNTSIMLDDEPARLDDLKRGFTAGALFNPTTLDALRVDAQSFPEVRGVIRSVSVEHHTLTIAPSTDEPEITLLVGPSTSISLNDRPARLEDLEPGFRVVAAYVEISHEALRVSAHSLGEVVGHIRDADLDSATVAITPLDSSGAVVLHVTHSTVITIGGEPATVNRLQTGMGVRAVFNLASFDAALIDARPLAP
jgi:Cu/Ag efflux protein CusF